MAQLNVRTTTPAPVTHGGVTAARITPLQELRRTVMSCLLWEDTFYENGVSIAQRIEELAGKVMPTDLAEVAIEARVSMNLRHVPLLLLALLAKHGKGKMVSETMQKVILRADELAEFLAVYWRNGKTPISKQVRVGLRRAFERFDAYQLAKYNRDKAISLRDVAFLVHPSPSDKQKLPGANEAGVPDFTLVDRIAKGNYKRGPVVRHSSLLTQLVNNTLPAPDTWEVALSAGGNAGEEFTRLLTTGKLGYLALLRNLRNMDKAGVSDALIAGAILARAGGAQKVLPFRYIAAARAVPRFEPQIDAALHAAINEMPPLRGVTLVLVDVSSSMHAALTGKSDMSRIDAAAALASIIPAEVRRVFTFSDNHIEVPPRLGMAGVDAILKSQPHCSTRLIGAVKMANSIPHDRLVVITDEQATDAHEGSMPRPVAPRAYMINVAGYRNGVGYGNGWTHLDGFSESVLRWMAEYETVPLLEQH